MDAFRIIPQLRKNCILQGKKETFENFKVGDTIFLITQNSEEKFSMISKIDSINYENENLIYIDKRLLDNLINDNEEIIKNTVYNETVKIVRYNPSKADKIYIAIPEESTRFVSSRLFTSLNKDWAVMVRKSLKNQNIDFGQKFVFLLPWSDKNGKNLPPIPVEGTIIITLPSPPVYIGNSTEIIIKKVSRRELEGIIDESIERKRVRVSKIEQELRKEIFQKIKKIKIGNYPHKTVFYEFKKTSPQQLFHAIIEIFKGFEFIEEPKERSIEGQNQNYLGSVVFFTDEVEHSTSIIDIQVIANNKSGKLIMSITSENYENIHLYLQKYSKIIHGIKAGLEESIDLNIEFCSNCGAPLSLEKVESDGIIQCGYCHLKFIIPKSLRY